ncbi:MAG: N-acetylglutaminylglutamine synthetase [Pseudomonadota bacterium]
MKPIARPTTDAAPDAALDMGWGRLVFAQTFSSPAELAAAMGEEGPDRRDIAVYVRDPHVVLAQSPQELFLDPSETYRLDLAIYRPSRRQARGFFIRRLCSRADAEAVNDIYVARGMVPVPPDFFWSQRDSRIITVYVAEDEVTGEILGSVTGVDHARAFGDPEKGSSLWCLAVAPQAAQPRIGEMLVRRLANFMKARGSAHLDLSVLHDNGSAITLYEKLGFTRVPYFAIKRKNPINEQLFIGPEPDPDFNPYARLIIDEARRRGIHTEAIDAPGGFFVLSHGGRSVRCRESLSEFTSAVAMSICDDKAATRRVVEAAGVSVPAQIAADDRPAVESFLARHGRVVVKPARGEQGRGVFIDLHDIEDVHAAIDAAGQISTPVIVEEFVEGEDLRLVVIDYRVVAAAVRRPAQIVGDGVSSARQLIDVQSRRRSVATGGESKIPFDAETERCLADCNLTLTDTPEKGQIVPVRKTANLHTGGTIHDVTDEAHPVLIQAAIDAARAIVIPVTGIDLMVKSPREPVYRFIEANERPGLANHEPRPTAERFLDLLFPMSAAKAVRGARAKGAA